MSCSASVRITRWVKSGCEKYRRQGPPRRKLIQRSGCVEGFGCRPIAAMRLAPWPASESLQWRNPREIAGGGAASAERYGGLRTTELREGNRRRWVGWLTTLRRMIGRAQVRESAVSQENPWRRWRRKGRVAPAPPLRIEGRRGRSGF